jgi:hypothetical protein
MDQQVDAAVLAQAYIAIRDEKERIQREADAQTKELSEQMKVVADALLEICKSTGADSIRTENGTVIKGIKSKYWTNDWNSFYDVVLENKAFDLLEKRIHQTNMKTFLEENPEAFPKGLNVDQEYTITVRRK